MLRFLGSLSLQCRAAPINAVGLCYHATMLVRSANAPPLYGQWLDLVSHTMLQAGAALDCPCVKNLMSYWLDEVCKAMDAATDRGNMRDNPAQAQMPQGQAKRLRLDEDLKKRWIVDDIVAKRCHTPGQALRFSGMGDQSSGIGNDWQVF